jgi:hypothetical protein
LSVAIFKKLLEFCKKLERNVEKKGEGKRRGQRIEAVRVDSKSFFSFIPLGDCVKMSGSFILLHPR